MRISDWSSDVCSSDLLFAGRAGSALAAEIGLMRATDQLSAMEMMAVDPMRHVIAPRFIAGVIAAPLLTAIFCVMAIGVAGGHAIGVEQIGSASCRERVCQYA